MPNPNNIAPGGFELWTGRIDLGQPIDPSQVQALITEYVSETHIPAVVGYTTEQPPAITLLRWPDNRDGYRSPTPTECDVALLALAKRIGAVSTQTGIVPEGKIHAMMGRKLDGYDGDEVAPMEVFDRGLPGWLATKGYMVSARIENGVVKPYGEEVGIIVADPEHEPEIHQIGDELKQFHYAIERGPSNGLPGRTDFYETRWASLESTAPVSDIG